MESTIMIPGGVTRSENVYSKLARSRVELQGRYIKKSGKNSYAKFTYYELSDFLPAVNEILESNGLFASFQLKKDKAELSIINTDKPEEEVCFVTTVPEREAMKGTNNLQALGATHTYLKRYLYLNAMEIVENDMVDATIGKNDLVKEKSDEIDRVNEEDHFNKAMSSVNGSEGLNMVINRFKEKLTQERKRIIHNKALELVCEWDDTEKKYVDTKYVS